MSVHEMTPQTTSESKPVCLVQSLGNGRYRWHSSATANSATANNGAAIASEGSLEELAVIHNQSKGIQLWLLLDARQLSLTTLPYNHKERRHFRQAAPFALEDSLISLVDEMHFAFAAPQDDQMSVVGCETEWLAEQLAPFSDVDLDLNLEICRVVPAPLLLPNHDGWVLCYADGDCWVRYGAQQGFMVEPELAEIALQRLLAEQGEPAQLLLLGENQQQVEMLQQWLPQGINCQPQVKKETLAQSLQAQTDVIDLRQGAFSRQLPVARWWYQWRAVAMVAGVALALFVGVHTLQYQQLKSEGLALRQQIEERYRSVVPRGVLVDPEKQLRNKVRALQGGGYGGGNALALLATLAPVVASEEGVVLRGINFNGRSGELRLSCWGESFEVLQQLRSKLIKQGLDVGQIQASADGGGMQARLVVTQKKQQQINASRHNKQEGRA